MTKFIIILILLFNYSTVQAKSASVKGHWKDTNHDGVKDTYIAPYQRTSPNKSKSDNYSSKGNYNPYTGDFGTKSTQPNLTRPDTSIPFKPFTLYKIR